MRTVIRGQIGETKGYIDNSGHRLIIRDSSGNMLGWYDKNMNRTFNKSGTCVGHGNILSFLLQDT